MFGQYIKTYGTLGALHSHLRQLVIDKFLLVYCVLLYCVLYSGVCAANNLPLDWPLQLQLVISVATL